MLSSIKNFDNQISRSFKQTLDIYYYSKKFKRKLPNLEETISKFKLYYNERNQNR